MRQTKYWGGKIGQTVQKMLATKYVRPFIIQQSGPYPGLPETFIELYFQDLILNQIKTDYAEAKHNFKFGYRLRHLYDEKQQCFRLWAGFHLQNKQLALHGFLDNVYNHKLIFAKQLSNWLNRSPQISWLSFGMGTEDDFIWQPHHTVKQLASQVTRYSQVKSNKNSMLPEECIELCCERELKKFSGFTPGKLKQSAQQVAKASYAVFVSLDFIYYHLWPQERRKQP